MFAFKHVLSGALLTAALGFSAQTAKADGYVSVGYSYRPTPAYCGPVYSPAPVYYYTPVYAPVVVRPPVYCPPSPPIYCPPVYCPPPRCYEPVRIYTPYRGGYSGGISIRF